MHLPGHEARQGKQQATGEENMTDAGQDRKEQESKADQETVEDLQPREDELAELKGGRSNWGFRWRRR
jgi:hypothetical protein